MIGKIVRMPIWRQLGENTKKGEVIYRDVKVNPVWSDFFIDIFTHKGNEIYFPWGGYLLYRLWPENVVFIDGQTDFYGEELTREYEKVITLGDGWQTIIEDYRINWVLMPVDSVLIGELRNNGDWEIVFEDSTSAAAVLIMEY